MREEQENLAKVYQDEQEAAKARYNEEKERLQSKLEVVQMNGKKSKIILPKKIYFQYKSIYTHLQMNK